MFKRNVQWVFDLCTTCQKVWHWAIPFLMWIGEGARMTNSRGEIKRNFQGTLTQSTLEIWGCVQNPQGIQVIVKSPQESMDLLKLTVDARVLKAMT